jgi:iron(III) transport system substrate-binding protein
LDASTLAQVDPKYRATDGTWTGFVARARVIAYDPRQVPTPPTSVAQVVDPKYAGKVGYAPTNASFQSFVTAMRVLWGEQRTKDWLTALKAGGAKTYEKNSAVLDAVERGEVALGLINHYYWYEKVNEVGADKVTSKIAFLPGDPGGMVNVAGAGVITSTDQAEAAQKFVAFLLTPAAQAGFVGDESEYPLAKGAAAPKGLPPLASLSPPALDLADLSGLTETVSMLEEVGIL